MSHVVIITLVLPFTKLLIIISIKCQAFSPVKHILSPRMYVLHGRKCILYLYACTSIQKPPPDLGSTLGQTAFCIHSIFSSPTHWLTLPFLFSKISCFLPWNAMVDFSIFFKTFQWRKFQLSYRLLFSPLHILIPLVLLRGLYCFCLILK